MEEIKFYENIVRLAKKNGYPPHQICALTGKLKKEPQWSIVDELNTWKEIDVLLLTTEVEFATINL